MARPPLSLSSLLLIPAIHTTILSSLPVSAYIPAIAVNDTSSLNLTDSSSIAIAWTDPSGVYSGAVSYQLKADVETGGTTSGALVHFSEATMGPNLTTSTPWIAYVSCDRNETGDSQEWDIFTLARDRGAVSALLYTASSESCLLNQEYIQDFEKPLDVFATKTVQVARVIDNQWTHTNNSFFDYNGTLLNSSGTDVNNSLAGNGPAHRTFLIGTLTARNSTGQAQSTDIPNSQPTGGSGEGHGPPGSMIALYVIVGIISVVFVLMICLGTRRAMRHPERYGRRAATDEQGPQTTARGLAQAILDTFPVIKFDRNRQDGFRGTRAKRVSSDAYPASLNLPHYAAATGTAPGEERAVHEKDARSARESVAMRSLVSEDTGSFHSAVDGPSGYGSMAGDDESLGARPTSMARSLRSPQSSRRASKLDLHHQAQDPMLENVVEMQDGRAQSLSDEGLQDQCPICLLDFEEGDDLRVLPCEREHVYHQGCIDPWLLQVSGSCPLCRKDFNQPSQPPTPAPTAPPIQPVEPPPSATSSSSSAQPPTQSGFAKYLAFMRRERGRGASGGGGERRRERGETIHSISLSHRRSRANTASTVDPGVGPGRSREADQTGPGGY